MLSGAVLLGTARARPDRHRRAAAEPRRGAVGLHRPRPAAVRHDACSPAASRPVLGLLAELLTDATYPDDRVEGERDRVAERIAIARSQPGVIARTALAARRYGDHPYAIQLPDDRPRRGGRRRRRCAGCTASACCPPAAASCWSATSTRAAATDAVADGAGRLGRRPGTPSRRRRHRSCACPGIELVDRPGAVQSNLRLGGPAPGRTDPDLPAVRLANMIFGGYFSSRLVENIRERRGYTYSPRSSVDHQAAGSSFLVEADVATEVTGPALLETWYELGRMALTPVTEAELDGARRYILGSMALSTATHAGLASTLSALIGAGLPAGVARRAPAGAGRGHRRGGPGGLAALPGRRGAHRRRRRRRRPDRRASCRPSAPVARPTEDGDPA